MLIKTTTNLIKWRKRNEYYQVHAAKALDMSLRQYQDYEWGNKPIDRTITALVFLHDYERNQPTRRKGKNQT